MNGNMGKFDDIKVSVICIAYNHSQYIREALDSVLAQETDFPIEIIVHDDASTDGTADIIREYAEKNANIIPILEDNNIMQKGEWIMRVCSPYIHGNYTALLECDDYWTDHYKLQKQVDFLDAHPEYSTSTHQTVSINMLTGETTLFSPFLKDKDCDINDVMRSGAFHTSANLFRSEVILEYVELLGGLYNIVSGDLGLRILAALLGRVHYSNELMSCYRQYSNPQSITYMKYVKMDEDCDKNVGEGVLEILSRIDSFSGQKYHRKLLLRAAQVIFSQTGFAYEKGDMKKEYVRLYVLYKLPIKRKIYVVMVEYFPKLYKMYKSIVCNKKRLNGR